MWSLSYSRRVPNCRGALGWIFSNHEFGVVRTTGEAGDHGNADI